MAFDWRTWIYGKVSNDSGVLALVPKASIYGSGSLEGSPASKPFLILSFDPEVPGPFPGSTERSALVWAHDVPGDYLAIDAVLSAVRAALVGQVPSQHAIGCRWSGDSQDLADESLGTITRNATFTMNGIGAI